MKLTEEQEKAFNELVKWIDGKKQLISLTGFAGVGKSFLLSKLKDKMPFQTCYTSMTGKAASRLREIGIKATTLHSILYKPPETLKSGELLFEKINEPPCRYLAIDESSLITPKIYNDLKYWIAYGVHIIFVGDSFQLPCIVSPEDKKKGYDEDFSVFSFVKGVRLNTIMRNTDEIIAVASKMRNTGEIAQVNTDNYKYITSSQLIKDTVDNYLNDRDNCVIITWRNKVRMQLNNEIRRKLGYTNNIPEQGEPVFICKNGDKCLNGEIKIVKNIIANTKIGELNTYRLLTTDGLSIIVSLDGKDEWMDGQLPYIRDWKKYMMNCRKLKTMPIPVSWGYCSTVHKMQGSGARKVIVALYDYELKSKPFLTDTRLPDGTIVPFKQRFLYTSFSRAEKELNVIIGE
jgi:hypothetical protein